MYESIRIQNFRGLKDLTIEKLGRVNLLVGANNVGKTSVLEAIWLLTGKTFPMRALEIAKYRGLDEPSPYTPESAFHGLFGEFALDSQIVLSGVPANGSKETLTITAGGVRTMVLGGRPMISENSGTSLFFRFESDGTTEESELRYDGEGRYLGPTSAHTDRAGQLLPAGAQMNIELLASGFTDASRAGQIPSIVAALRSTEPRLVDLRLGYSAEEKRPTIEAVLSDLDSGIPLELLGTGSRRLLDILVSTARLQGGAFMLDEVDNGFYYATLEAVWRSIDVATDLASVQLFATTHSWECVTAAVEAFRGDPDAFNLVRLDRIGDEVVPVSYDHEVALAATTGLVEVR